MNPPAGDKAAWAPWQNASWSDVQVGDFDGLDDIAGRDGGSWHVGRSTGSAFTTSLWGEWDHVAWQAVAALDADSPPRLPSAAPTSGASLAQYWSSVDDDELAALLMSA